MYRSMLVSYKIDIDSVDITKQFKHLVPSDFVVLAVQIW